MAQGRVRPYLRVPQGEGFGIATSLSFALASPEFFTTIAVLSWFSVSCRILFFFFQAISASLSSGRGIREEWCGEISPSEAMRA